MKKHLPDPESPRATIESGAGLLHGYNSLAYCGARLARAPTTDFYECLNYVMPISASQHEVCESCWARFVVARQDKIRTSDR